MDDPVGNLLSRVKALEDELRIVFNEKETRTAFPLKGKRIELVQSIEQATSRLKKPFFSRLVANRPQNLITGPIIYSMIIPLLVLDLFVSFYQATCFPIYRVEKVRRADYIVLDRQHLECLNFVEKFHCTYCAYGAGLIAYAGEIVARTEQYFCPIKHAQKVLGRHSRYSRFLEYGQAEALEARLEAFRIALEKMRQD